MKDDLEPGIVDSEQEQSDQEVTPASADEGAIPAGERGGILEGLLHSFLGAAPTSDQEEETPGPMLGGLHSFLGTGPAAAPQEEALGGMLGGLMQSLMGTGPAAAPQEEAPGAMLGSLPGGGETGAGSSQLLPAILGQLTDHLDLPSETVQTILTFLLSKLFASQADRAAGQRLEVSGLFEQAGSEEASIESAQRTTDLARELAEKTGLDVDTALEALQAIAALLGGKELPAKKKRKSTRKKTTASAKPKTTTAKKKTTASAKPKTTTTKKKTTASAKPKTTTAKKKTTASAKPKSTSKKSSS